ncbi:hypothetical protein [Candidatus Nitrosocosmicus hydrocola]|uniref:hypothetical protein n=1 Tax=Candidatus Nitrosocosmicus hydrocola TaxID=1826872 RepID=UPI001373798C|nr:hypothetical protein [Candidatus Nitrosocosmicus hydrocola]
MSEFYDGNSPLSNNTIEDKSPIDLESDITLCALGANIILLDHKDNKFICPQYGNI